MDSPIDSHHDQGVSVDKSESPSLLPKRSNLNASSNVLKQSKARKALRGNIAALPSRRIERGSNGEPYLAAIFPNKRGEPDRVNLSFLLDTPNLADLLSRGFLQWGCKNAPKTRAVLAGQLKGFWCCYLHKSSLSQIKPEDIDEQILAGFNKWLQGPIRKVDGDKGKGLSPNTIRKALGCLRLVLEGTSEGFGIAQRIPSGPIGAYRKHKPTATLIDAELLRVIQVADRDILALRARWVKGRKLLERGYKLLNSGATLERHPRERAEAKSEDNLALCLAMLDATYPGVVPDIKVINKFNRLLANTILYAFGMREITGYLYPSARDIVPLVLNLAVTTNFNADTVLGLCWSNVDRNVDRLGTASVEFRVDEASQGDMADEEGNQDLQMAGQSEGDNLLVKVTGEKPRAGQQLVRLLDPRASSENEASLNLTLDLIHDMTVRLRPHVWSEHSDRIFLYMPEVRSKQPKGFGFRDRKNTLSADCAWHYGLKRFISDNDLPNFSLKNIRATLMSLVQIAYPGDLIKGQEMGNHKNFTTTWNHYTSEAVRKILREHTGAILLARDRWLKTQGKIDPRKTSEKSDKGCATPGFGCFDPFDSPRPNQEKGRLCDAYGECPACPLVMLRPGAPEEVVYWEALERAIYRSHSSMTREMWMSRWGTILSDLKALIALVPSEIVDASRHIRIELPNVG